VEAGRIVDRYELVRLLGRGAQGEVWEAVLLGAMGFRRPVALKVFRGEAHAALLREARLGALLSHPNLGATFDCGTSDGFTWVAMALLQGPTLAQLVARGPLSPALVVDAGLQVAAALAHAHALPVESGTVSLLHLDVKPSNVVLDASGVLKLVDLGVAVLAGAVGTGGTLGYCPSEQLGGTPDPRSDLYALGMTLVVLATGARPWAGHEPVAWTRRIEDHLPALVRAADAAVPGLGEVVRGTVRARPEDRWGDAEAVAAALVEVRSRLPSASARWGEWLVAPTPSAAIERESTSGDLLVGREALLDRALRAMAGGRIVTLVGPGGMGKTRLARAMLARAPGAGRVAHFVELVGVVDAAAVAQAVALALGVGARPDELSRALAAHPPLLLVLDNAEQVEGLAPLVGGWASGTSTVAFVVTSRVPLGVAGEEVLPVPPLDPAAARALYASLSPRGEVPDLGALDGLPLAIELLALRGDAAPVTDRHRSLGDVLGASIAGLPEPHREALRDLAVFVGSFSLEAACAVVRSADASAVARLDGLLAAGLLQPSRGRLRVLVPIRDYVSARTRPAERRAAEVRHGAWFAQLVPPLDAMLRRAPPIGEDLAEVLTAHDRAAARSAEQGLDTDRRVVALTALLAGEYLHESDDAAAARTLLEAGFAANDPQVSPMVGVVLADLLNDEFDTPDAVGRYLAPALASPQPEVALRARFLDGIFAQRAQAGVPRAEPFAEIARAWDRLGRPREAIQTCVSGATLLLTRGAAPEARALLALRPLDDPSLSLIDRARCLLPMLATREVLGDRTVLGPARWLVANADRFPRRLAARALEAVAHTEMEVGDLARAEPALARSLALYERMGLRAPVLYLRQHHVRLLLFQGRVGEARAAGVALLAEGQLPGAVALVTRLNVAEACALEDDPRSALRWVEAAAADARGPLHGVVVDVARGMPLAAAGDADGAVAALGRAERSANEHRFLRLAAMARAARLRVEWDAGRLPEPLAAVRAALAAREVLTREVEAELLGLWVEVEARSGRRAEAQGALDALLACEGSRATWPGSRAARVVARAREALDRTG
jgi:predicted ATPase